MAKAPRLDEIDLGAEKRRIEFAPIFSVIWIIVVAVASLLTCGGLVGTGLYGGGGRPGTDDSKTMIILGLVIGGILALLVPLMIAGRIYWSNERLIVFADGICHEHWSRQECYRWKDIRKIVWYSADPRVYWLYFKNGRKIPVSLLGGVAEKDWSSLRNLLERKLPDKFVDES